MSIEHMGVLTECWPLFRTQDGIWLASGRDAWRTGRLDSDTTIHFEMEGLLHRHGAVADLLQILHSPSWRPEPGNVMLTYFAVLHVDDELEALNRWPAAMPVSPELVRKHGAAPTHSATEMPVPRHIDVLRHAIRHLRYLMCEDIEVALTLDNTWRRHLMVLSPALAGLYVEPHLEAS